MAYEEEERLKEEVCDDCVRRVVSLPGYCQPDHVAQKRDDNAAAEERSGSFASALTAVQSYLQRKSLPEPRRIDENTYTHANRGLAMHEAGLRKLPWSSTYREQRSNGAARLGGVVPSRLPRDTLELSR